jgi:hypothetical protein
MHADRSIGEDRGFASGPHTMSGGEMLTALSTSNPDQIESAVHEWIVGFPVFGEADRLSDRSR